jgi:5-methylcytosine-specific restriction endonuclease McrA
VAKKRSITALDKAKKNVTKLEHEVNRWERSVTEHKERNLRDQKYLTDLKIRAHTAKIKIQNESMWDNIRGKYESEKSTIASAEYLTQDCEPSSVGVGKILQKYKMKLSEARKILSQEINKNVLKEEKKIDKEKKEAERRKIKAKKLQQVKAKASAFEGEIRRGTGTIKARLKEQIDNLPKCPYCLKPLSFSLSHADHIYPVNKGGLTTDANMVLVCAACNLKKRDLTLRQFCRKTKISYGDVCERLEALHKDI